MSDLYRMKKTYLDSLRRRATALTPKADELDDFVADTKESTLGLEKLLHELQIYQAELEMQNDELSQTVNLLDLEKSRFQNLFDASPLGILTLNRTGEILSSNLVAKELLGTERFRKRPSISIYTLITNDSADTFSRCLEECSLGLPIKPFLVHYQDPSQERIFKIFLEAFAGGNTFSGKEYLVMIQDVTVEEQLKQQEILFSTLVQKAPDMIAFFDKNVKLCLANSKFLDFFATGPDKSIANVSLPQELSSRITSLLEQNSNIGTSASKILLYHHPRSRKLHYLELHVFEAKIEAMDKAPGIGLILIDATNRVHNEEELKLAFQVFNEGNQALLITNEQKHITFVNQACLDITGYTRAEIMDKNPRVLSSGRHDAPFYKAFWKEIEEQGHWEGEIWNQSKDGRHYPQWLRVSRYPKKSQDPKYYIATFSDITRQKRDEEKIQQLAYYDTLTKIGNRNALKEKIKSIQSSEVNFHDYTLFFIDLDAFKMVNDLYGHDTGDRLLESFAQRMRKLIRPGDGLFRIGGDEFLMIIEGLDENAILRKAEDLCNAARTPYRINNREHICTVSVGIVRYPEHGESFSEIMKRADVALYQSKGKGRDQFQFFEPQMLKFVERRAYVEQCIKKFTDHHLLTLHFQPQYEIKTNALYKVEALLRWNQDDLPEPVSVEELIEVAEETKLILEITRHVLNHTLMALRDINKNLGLPLTIAINISSYDLIDDEQFTYLEKTLVESGELAKQIEFEVTERTLMSRPHILHKRLERLKSLGVKIAIDDFGTGYSSFGFLGNFEVNLLKIDKSFVDGIGTNGKKETICASIIQLSHSLGLKCLAEGVETKAQYDWLEKQGCQYIQGYYLSKPLSLNNLKAELMRINHNTSN